MDARAMPILMMSLTQVILPGVFIYSLIASRDDARLPWLLKAAYVGTYALYIALAGRWDWISYYMRFVPLIVTAVAVPIAYRRVRGLPWTGRRGVVTVTTVASALALTLFVTFLALAVRGRFYDGDAVRLVFPLRDGHYYVGQGGNSPVINAHNTHPTQRYALDILQLNAIGARAQGVYPSALGQYEIFGATVYSPCSGTIVEAVDGLDDLPPTRSDPARPAGNHVIVDCGSVHVVLAHMQKGSVLVQAGTPVSPSDALGLVGNSGNTSEPHLHIHAMRPPAAAEDVPQGVPMLFDGRFLVRNSTIP